MSPRTGRPKAESPKDKLLQVRMDSETMQILDECAERKGTTRAGIVREGIKKVKAELDK